MNFLIILMLTISCNKVRDFNTSTKNDEQETNLVEDTEIESLYQAITEGEYERVKHLINKLGAGVSSEKVKGALLISIKENYKKITKFLAKKRKDIKKL